MTACAGRPRQSVQRSVVGSRSLSRATPLPQDDRSWQRATFPCWAWVERLRFIALLKRCAAQSLRIYPTSRGEREKWGTPVCCFLLGVQRSFVGRRSLRGRLCCLRMTVLRLVGDEDAVRHSTLLLVWQALGHFIGLDPMRMIPRLPPFRTERGKGGARDRDSRTVEKLQVPRLRSG